MQITIGNLGAILGTQLYRTETAPRYVLGHSFALAYLCLNVCVAGLTWWILKRENKRRDGLEEHGVQHQKHETGVEGDDDVSWRFTV